jgi:hypothetical protein
LTANNALNILRSSPRNGFMKDQPNISLSALPLKAYDFFSIVFPGVAVLLSAYFFEELYFASQAVGQSGPVSCCLAVHWLLKEVWRNSGNASSQAAIVAISVCIIYLAGQLVSSIANFFLDRIFVYKCYGYPYEHMLLDDQKKDVYVDYCSRRFYRGSIFWLHVAAFSFALYDIYNTELIFGIITIACTGIFCVAVLIHLLSQFLYKRQIKIERPFKYFIKKYVLCYRILMNPIQHINQTAKPMQKDMCVKYKELFKHDFGIDPLTAESDNFWLSLFYVRQKDAQMSELIQRWHQTAIFARNMATSFYMAFGYSAVILWYETAWKKHFIHAPDNFRLTVALSGLFALAIFLVIRFYYFYVSYYSKCLFRAFVFLHLYKDTVPVAGKDVAIPH